LLVLGLLATAPALLASEPGVAVTYDAYGYQGQLYILQAQGLPFVAHNSQGVLVASGVVTANYFVVPASHSGPSPQGWLLHVRVGGQIFHVTDWEWMQDW
jgi:hypothetical protein